MHIHTYSTQHTRCTSVTCDPAWGLTRHFLVDFRSNLCCSASSEPGTLTVQQCLSSELIAGVHEKSPQLNRFPSCMQLLHVWHEPQKLAV